MQTHIPCTRSGRTLYMTRTSPGWRNGYLSWPRYFFASAARCANAFFVKRSRYCSGIVAMASWSQIRRAESIPLDARPAAGPQGAQGGPPMLYIAFVKNKPRWQLGDVDLTAKSRQWWNEGE